MMTIGHSTLTIEAFLRALRENGCSTLVDVRRYPGSRRYPQFGQAALFASLREAGIRGVWREGLGGRRAPLRESLNTGWKNESFRGYADYMQTVEFAREIDWLMGLEDSATAVVMCAEAVPWSCHRSLIGDAVLARGGAMEDIFVKPDGESRRRLHEMTAFARSRERVCGIRRLPRQEGDCSIRDEAIVPLHGCGKRKLRAGGWARPDVTTPERTLRRL